MSMATCSLSSTNTQNSRTISVYLIATVSTYGSPFKAAVHWIQNYIQNLGTLYSSLLTNFSIDVYVILYALKVAILTVITHYSDVHVIQLHVYDCTSSLPLTCCTQTVIMFTYVSFIQCMITFHNLR